MDCRHLIGFIGLALVACGGDGEDKPANEPPPSSECMYKLGEECVGLLSRPICADTFCSDGAFCEETFEVTSDMRLAELAPTLSPGACIALAAGSYSAVTLDRGVSLLGVGADLVTLTGPLDAPIGSGNRTIRGITVVGDVSIGSGSTTIDRVRVVDGSGYGIQVQFGGSLIVRSSEVHNAADGGIRARDAASLTVSDSVIVGSGDAGISALCPGGCLCTAPGTVDLANVLLQQNAHAGIVLSGVSGSVRNVEVTDTVERASDRAGGGGVAISACADIRVTDATIAGSRSFGVLVSAASAQLSGLAISDNLVGMWLDSLPDEQFVSVRDVELLGNHGVGFGARGVLSGTAFASAETTTISDVRVADTFGVEMVIDGGTEQVGDGLLWLDGSLLEVSVVSVSNSARQDILIDGPVAQGSRLTSITLDDSGSGVLQQNAADGANAPGGDDLPPITTANTTVHAVPLPPEVPNPAP